ncbi:MAG: lamin tail domain-containing protein [Saprospiraceae bacterium]|nr:lamin tail domain-containing protein [Saprospiraceae bacterium]
MKNLLSILFVIGMTQLNYSQIVISEIMYNPPESGTDFLEYIEFYNAGNNSVNINDYKIPDAVVFTFPDTVLQAGSYIVVCVDSVRLDSIFQIKGLEWVSGGLRNTDEVITLLDAAGNFVDSVHYFSSWSSSTNGNGASLELCRVTADNSMQVYWRASVSNTQQEVNAKIVLGSPGNANQVACADHTVNLMASSFIPNDISIYVGEQVEWINGGGLHNVNGDQSIFRDNPESFYSGPPASGNWSFIHQFNTAGTYEYQCDIHGPSGMTGVVRVKNKDVNYPDIPIALLRTTNANGVIDSVDKRCTVEGTVYGVNLRPAGLQFTIIDNANDGIGVFLSSGNLNYTVNEGDVVRIKGLATQFNGLAQINLDSLKLLSTGAALVLPTIVNLLDETTESQLIQIKNVELVDPMTWTNNPLGFTAKITDGNREFDLRIDNDVNIHGTMPPSGKFNVTGIGSQFDASSPYFDNYQIMPRYLSDIELVTKNADINPKEIYIFPTVAHDMIYITSDVPFTRIKITDVNGKQVMSQKFTHSVELDMDPGIYWIQLIGTKSFQAKFIKI